MKWLFASCRLFSVSEIVDMIANEIRFVIVLFVRLCLPRLWLSEHTTMGSFEFLEGIDHQ